MSTAQEAPSLIQYACERCKTRFVLPPSRRRLGFGGRLKASGMALSHTLRFHEGLGSTYDGARRQLLAKMDDDAYQSFVQSFKFCHECRQFVCSECWSNSRKTCLGCFAKAAGTTVRQRPPFAPEGPSIPRPVAASVLPARRRRLRTDASLLVMGAAVLLLVVELVFILPGLGRNSGGVGPSPTEIAAVNTPTAGPTDLPSAAPTDSPTAEPTASPSPSPSPSPTASPSPSPSPTKAPAPPKLATPTISCNYYGGAGNQVQCTSKVAAGASRQWYVDGHTRGKSASPIFSFTPGFDHTFYLTITLNGQHATSSKVTLHV